MYLQALVDMGIVIGMFALRIGVPVVLTVALGYWLEKRLRPAETAKGAQPAEQPRRVIPFPRAGRPAATESTQPQQARTAGK